MTVSQQDIGWLAGLVEGEGCISTHNNHDSRSGKTCEIATLSVSMTDFDIVDRAQSVLGLGSTWDHLRGDRPHCKPQRRWTVRKQTELLQVLYLLWPLLGERRRQAATAAIKSVLSSPSSLRTRGSTWKVL